MPSLRRSLAMALLAPAALLVAEIGSAANFTYQGRLDEDGAPKEGTVDLRFDAFALDSGGAPLNAVPVIRDGVPLTGGVFTVDVDFGANVFTGAAVFVQVSVREDVAGNASTLTGFTDLVPRQVVTATPYAQHAATVGADAVSSVQIANGSIIASDANTTSASDGLQRRVSSSCAVNNAIRVINSDGSVECDSDDVGAGAAAWGLSGNSGTNPATNFIGTTNSEPLVIRSNNERVASLESVAITTGHTANVLLGSPANTIDSGVRGATIGGGGVPSGDSDPDNGGEGPNRVSDHYGTIGGGFSNTAGDAAGAVTGSPFATVGGGRRNTASGNHSTVGGGEINTASGFRSTVSGGAGNTASGGQDSTVSGGFLNAASGSNSTVGGGGSNVAFGSGSTVSGGAGNAALGASSTVGGGEGNAALGLSSTVGSGSDNCAGGENSWAGGTQAKVRPRLGTGTNPSGSGCDSVENTADANGDEGSFVWADNHNGDYVSQGPNQFLIRVAGGVGVQPGNGTASELANVPEAPLHVFKGSAGAVAANQDAVAVFESDTAAFVSILGPVSQSRGLQFGEEGDNTDGGIVYNPDNSLHLRANGDVTRLAIEGDGDVGIGTETAAVTNRLHVTDDASSTALGSHAVLLENTSGLNITSVLALKIGAATAGTGHNFITFFKGDGGGIGQLEGNGNGGVQLTTTGADYAEWLPRMDAGEVIAPGDVVGLHAGGTVSKRLDGAIQVLIASTGAAIAGNSPGATPEDTHTLTAFVGQVQARVCGPVRAGDAILAADDGSGCGVARAPQQLAAHEFARIAGTAWEGAEGEGEHRVRVAVGLGDADAERVVLLSRIDALEAKLSTQQALVDASLAREAKAVVTSARQASFDGFEYDVW